MDPETIASTATLITAIGGFLALLGTGIWKLIVRADSRREKKEEQWIDRLDKQIEEMKAAHEKEVHKLNARILHEQRLRHLREKDGMEWWGQLKDNDIEPKPARWSEMAEELRND